MLLDMKTDLNLLLECLKYQMDCPLSQKEALITIYIPFANKTVRKEGFSLETMQSFLFTMYAKKLVGPVKMSKGHKVGDVGKS